VSVEQQKELLLKIGSHCGARPALNQLSLNSSAQSSMATGATACGNHLFSGAVFNSCTIVIGERSPQLPSKRKRIVIQEDDDERTYFEFNFFTIIIVTKFIILQKFSLSKRISFLSFFLPEILK